jgi:cell division protein FtsL
MERHRDSPPARRVRKKMVRLEKIIFVIIIVLSAVHSGRRVYEN